jgi:hypothetical protein
VSLLTGLNKLVADVAGPLLFEQARLLRGGSYSINPATGQTVFTPSTEYVKAIESDYSAFHRQSLDIPDINRKLSILGYQVTTPRPGDRVSIRGIIWEIVRVERDPANALYECEVKPIGADLAGDPGATVNALTPLPGLLASIAGPLLFGPATLFRAQTTSIDSNGQASRTETSQIISGLEVEYTATHRAQAGIPETDRSLLVLGAGLSSAPVPGDRIDINGTRFEIVRTQRDPARAVYECQSRPIGVAVSIRYATHAGTLPAYVGAATAQLTFFYHAGILPAFQSIANAAALISAVSGSSFPALSGQAIAGAGALAYTGGVLAPYTGNATARVDIAAAHAGSLSLLAGAGIASIRVSGVHAGTLAPITGTAEASGPAAGASATHAGTLPSLSGAAMASAATAASQVRALPAFGGTATGAAAVAAGSLRSLPAYQGSGQATNAASGQSGRSLPPLSGTATAAAAMAASHGGILPAFSGVRTATGAVSAVHAGSLPAITGTATAALTVAGSEATHAGTLPALTGTATAAGAVAATQAQSLPAYQGTAVASNAQAATQARSLPAFTGAATSVNGVSATQASNLPAYTGTATATSGGGTRTAPVFRSSTQSLGSGVINRPAGVVQGDLLVGYFFDFVTGGVITIPAGWTLIGSQVSKTDFEMRRAYKIAGPSEPATYSWSSSLPDFPAAMIAAYTINTFDASVPIGAHGNSTGSGVNRIAPSVTADFENSELLTFTAGYPQTSTGGISGMTEVQDINSENFYELYRQAIAASGATGTRSQPQNTGAWLATSVIINGYLPPAPGETSDSTLIKSDSTLTTADQT